MAKNVEVKAIDKNTIQIKLPDGLSVVPGKPVPPEVLDMVAAFAKLQGTEAGEPEAGWCIGGCQGQL